MQDDSRFSDSSSVTEDCNAKRQYLSALYDISRRVAALAEMEDIATAFLDACFDALGISRGFVQFVDETRQADLCILKGFNADEERLLFEKRTALTEDSLKHAGQPGEDIRLVECPRPDIPLPEDVCVLSSWQGAGETIGLVGFGSRADGQIFGSAESEFIRNLVIVLASGLERSLQRRVIVHLNETLRTQNYELTQRNRDLQSLLEEVTECRIEAGNIEESRKRIVEAVRRETSRVGQVRRMDFIFIILLSLLVGVLFNEYSPNRVDVIPRSWVRPSPRHIELSGAYERFQGGELFVDARPAEFYRQGHIKGAVNVPASLFDFVYAMRFAGLDRGQEIIVYGSTISRLYDENVAHLLGERGFVNVRVMSSGFGDWAERAYPEGP